MRVLITGLGCVSGLGLSIQPFWAGLVAGMSGVRPLDWPPAECSPKVPIGARVWGYQPEGLFPCDRIPLLDRFSQFALLAAREAVADACFREADLSSAGLVIGSGCCGKETDEQTYQRLYRDGRHGSTR